MCKGNFPPIAVDAMGELDQTSFILFCLSAQCYMILFCSVKPSSGGDMPITMGSFEKKEEKSPN